MKRSLLSTNDSEIHIQEHESRSSYISFYEDEKVRFYKVNFQKMIQDGVIKNLPMFSECEFISVTTIISQIFPKFDKDKIIGSVKENPFSGYGDKKTVDIDDLWEKMKKEGSSSGTNMHSFVEDSLKPFLLKKSLVQLSSKEEGLIPYFHRDIYSTEFDSELEINDPLLDFETKENATYFKMILSEIKKLSETGHPNLSKYLLYKLEWRIFDESVNISGTIDCVLINPNNQKELILLDWKRSKEIKSTNKFESCDHVVTKGMPNCNERKYSIQLNLYKRILENRYGSVVTSMYIVNVSPVHQMCKIFFVENLSGVIDKLYDFRTRQLSEELSKKKV